MQVIAHVSRLFLCIARQESMVGEGNGNPLSILAWEIPQKRSLVGYSPCCRKRVRHNLVTKQQQTLHGTDGLQFL